MKSLIKDKRVQACSAVLLIACVIFGYPMIMFLLVVATLVAVAILIAIVLDRAGDKWIK